MATIFHPTSRRRRLPTAFIGGLACVALSSMVAIGLDRADQNRARAELQEVVDNAALAGVTALARTEGQSNASRIAAAATATHGVISNTLAGAHPRIASHVDELRISVSLTQEAATGLLAWSRAPISVTGRAQYLRPNSAAPERNAPTSTLRPTLTRG
jgi:Flp pilus assembly protein TadG